MFFTGAPKEAGVNGLLHLEALPRIAGQGGLSLDRSQQNFPGLGTGTGERPAFSLRETLLWPSVSAAAEAYIDLAGESVRCCGPANGRQALPGCWLIVNSGKDCVIIRLPANPTAGDGDEDRIFLAARETAAAL